MNRRRFVGSLGVTTLLPAAREALANSASNQISAAAGRSHVDLNGAWERYVGGELFDTITVPSSQRPMGLYRVKRTFLLPRMTQDQRAFLCFEGITYFGRVSVNGAELGTMGPYVPYTFEFTDAAKEGRNLVEVAIADACAEPDGSGRDELPWA